MRRRWGKAALTALAFGLAASLLTTGCATGRSGSPFTSSRKGTPWTIHCLELRGPERQVRMEQIAETLRRTPGIRANKVRVTDDPDGVAQLYYGTYYRRSNPKTGARSMPTRLREDLDLIRQLGTGPGKYFFIRALAIRKPVPDVGPPEWALSSTTGVYTLQVAVFEPTDTFWDYKEAALAFCKLLRKRGHEAYYHHTASSSLVTVGVFGPEAVIQRRTARAGRNAWETVYAPEIQALQREELLRYNLVNGAVHKIGPPSGPQMPVPSRLVEIPHPDEFLP